MKQRQQQLDSLVLLLLLSQPRWRLQRQLRTLWQKQLCLAEPAAAAAGRVGLWQ
jgi:hypothetical protein